VRSVLISRKQDELDKLDIGLVIKTWFYCIAALFHKLGFPQTSLGTVKYVSMRCLAIFGKPENIVPPAPSTGWAES